MVTDVCFIFVFCSYFHFDAFICITFCSPAIVSSDLPYCCNHGLSFTRLRVHAMCEGLLFSYQVYTFLFLMTFVCILNKDTIYICKGIILLDTIPKLLLRLFSLQPRLSPCPLRSVWCRLLCLHLQSESDLKQNSKVILTHTAKI